MENASKALIMAGSVLIAIMIIGAFFMMYNQLTSTKREEQKALKIEQVVKFNATFESYNKKKEYGADLVSLANKITDYNSRQANEQKGYEIINGNVTLKNIRLILNTSAEIKLLSGCSFEDIDKYIEKIEKRMSEIEENSYIRETGMKISDLISYYNSGKLIDVLENDDDYHHNKIYYQHNVEPYIKDYIILKDALADIKRKYFRCTNVEYSEVTGRIVRMDFAEIQ